MSINANDDGLRNTCIIMKGNLVAVAIKPKHLASTTMRSRHGFMDLMMLMSFAQVGKQTHPWEAVHATTPLPLTWLGCAQKGELRTFCTLAKKPPNKQRVEKKKGLFCSRKIWSSFAQIDQSDWCWMFFSAFFWHFCLEAASKLHELASNRYEKECSAQRHQKESKKLVENSRLICSPSLAFAFETWNLKSFYGFPTCRTVWLTQLHGAPKTFTEPSRGQQSFSTHTGVQIRPSNERKKKTWEKTPTKLKEAKVVTLFYWLASFFFPFFFLFCFPCFFLSPRSHAH